MKSEARGEVTVETVVKSVEGLSQDAAALQLASGYDAATGNQDWGPIPFESPNLRKRKLGQIALWGILTLAEGFLLLEVSGYRWPIWTSVPFVLALALFNFKVWLHNRISQNQPSKTLASDSLHKDELFVRMWVRQAGQVTGADKGVLWVDGDALWFHGERSWFCLPRQSIEPPSSDSLPNSAFPGQVLLRVDTVEIEFQENLPIRGFPQLASPDLNGEIAKFLQTSNTSQNDLQLPPLARDPSYTGRLAERPHSAAFRRFMTHPLYSTRWYVLVTMELCYFANLVGHIRHGIGVMIVPLVPVIFLNMSILQGLSNPRVSRLSKHPILGRNVLSFFPRREALMDVSETTEELTTPAGVWAPSSAESIVLLKRTWRKINRTLLGVATVEIVALALGLVMHMLAVRFIPFCLANFIVLDTMLYWMVRKFSRREDDPRLRRSVAADDQPVRAWIEVDGVVRGADLGRFWIADNAAHFEGLRTQFSLARQDLNIGRPSLSYFNREIGVVEMGYTFDVQSPEDSLRVSFQSIRGGSVEDESNKPMETLVRELFESFGAAQSTSVLPPLEFDQSFCVAPWFPSSARRGDDSIFFILLAVSVLIGAFLAPWWFLALTIFVAFEAVFSHGSILPGRLRAISIRRRFRVRQAQIAPNLDSRAPNGE